MSHSRQPWIINFPFHGERTLRNEGRKNWLFYLWTKYWLKKNPKIINFLPFSLSSNLETKIKSIFIRAKETNSLKQRHT